MAVGLGSLVNTLQGLNPSTFAQALQEEEQRRLAEQTALAAGQAQQAGAAYQGAAGAPPPELGLAEAFIPALLGNIASVIGQNPQYAQQGQERIQQSRATLMKSRADNLQALRDVWAQKAEMAQRAGDLEAEATARQKQEQISKTFDLVRVNAEHAARREENEQKQSGALALEGERGKQDRLTVGARGAQDRATLAAEGGKADRDARKASLAQGVDPDTGFILRTVYAKEANKLRIAASKARGGDQKNAILSGVVENELQRVSGESPLDYYFRLKSASHPFDTENVKGRKGKVAKKLFTPAEVIETLKTSLGPGEGKPIALRAARTGDLALFRALIEADQTLDGDPEIVAQAQRLAGTPAR